MPRAQTHNEQHPADDDDLYPRPIEHTPADETLVEVEAATVEETLVEDELQDLEATVAEDDQSVSVATPADTDATPVSLESLPDSPFATQVGWTEVPVGQVREAWQPGDIIADLYEVKELLGHGAMGTVHRVHHRNWNLDLAVKTPTEKALEAAGGRERFQEREAYEWIRLGLHPNIAPCFYVRTLDDGIPRLFIEYVEGGSLKDWLAQDKVTDLATALDIWIQICWGLGWAHQRGLIHRDIKPANILMTVDGTPKVTDFGLVKPMRETSDEAVYEAEIAAIAGGTLIAGTPGYAAPEQWQPDATITAAADVYALGVVLYELLQRPLALRAFPDADPMARPALYQAVLKKHKQALAQILLRCLDHQPQRRYADAATLADTLLQTYATVAGRVFPRRTPGETKIFADGLNNQAISLLDLDKQEEAEQQLDEALSIEPTHPEAIYNRGLLLWRSGRITDADLVWQLEAARKGRPEEWRYEYLLGLVHLERGDIEAAVPALEIALAASGEESQVGQALEEAKAAQSRRRKRPAVLRGHLGQVNSVAISADGRTGLSGSKDQSLRLWDLTTGECLRVFEGHTGQINSVAISSDGRIGLSGSADETLRLWDLAAGNCLRTLEGHWGPVTSVSISPDGRLGLSGSRDYSLRLWDLTTGVCRRMFGGFGGFTGEVTSVSLSPDGRFGLAACENKLVQLWELDTGVPRDCLGHSDKVTSVAISIDHQLGLSGSRDQTLRLWELETGQWLRIFEGYTDKPTSVAMSADKRWAVCGGEDRTLRLLDLGTGQCLRTCTGHLDTVTSVTISPDGQLGFSGSGDKTLRTWHLGPVKRASYMPVPPSGVSEAALFQSLLENARQALEAGRIKEANRAIEQARQIRGYQQSPEAIDFCFTIGQKGIRKGLRSGWPVRAYRGLAVSVDSIAISSDGRYALSASWESGDKTVLLWDLVAGESPKALEGHPQGVNSVAITPNGRFGLSGSRDHTVQLWNLEKGQRLRTLKGHTDDVTSVSISPDGRWGLSGSNDETLRMWDLIQGQWLRTFEGHIDQVNCVDISPDGRFGLSGSSDKTLRMWDLATGDCLRTFEGHAAEVASVAVTPNGRYGLSGSLDRTLRLWDLSTGMCRGIYKGHADLVTCVAISPDGRFGLSGSKDETVRLWNLATRKCLGVFEGHAGPVTSVAISLDGRFGFSGGLDNTLRMWRFDWAYEFPEPADWEKGARPYLEIFLTLHSPYGPDGISRSAPPGWTASDFQLLLIELGYRGFGWLRSAGVAQLLRDMARKWREPPPLPKAHRVARAKDRLKIRRQRLRRWWQGKP